MTDTQMVEANDAKLQSLFMGRFCGPVPPLLVVELIPRLEAEVLANLLDPPLLLRPEVDCGLLSSL